MRELDLLYYEGFITRALDDGMSKEAAAELLMHASVQRGNPDYAEGFYARGSRPVLSAEDFDKRAALSKNVLNVGRGLWDAGKGLGGIVKDVFTGGGRAARNFAGPAKQIGSGAPPVQPWVVRNPRTAFALGAGVAGGGTFLGHRLLSDPASDSSIPFIPGEGSYDAAGAKARQEGLSESTSKGVFELNKKLNSGVARQGDLEAATAKGGPESHLALAELLKMKSDRGSAGYAKMQHAKELESAGARLGDQFSNLTNQRRSLQAARDGAGGVGGWFRRLWYNMNGDGRDANSELDAKILGLQQRIGDISSRQGLVSDQQSRLGSGSTGVVRVPNTDQVQRDFFPTYK